MRDKFINFGSCVSIFAPNRQINFGTNPPVNILSGPSNTRFYYWAGSVSFTSNPSTIFGTIGRIRQDDGVFKHDQWLVTSTGTANIIRIADVPKNNVVNPPHHYRALPQTLTNDISDWNKEHTK